MRTAITIGPGALAAILVCVIALAASGCAGNKPTPDESIQKSSEKLREAVSSNVKDEGRRGQMLKLVDQVEAVQRSYGGDTTKFIEGYRKINADYAVPRATYDQLFAQFNTQRIQARDRALDLHFQLSALATAKEWDDIGKAEAEMYGELGESLVQQRPQ